MDQGTVVHVVAALLALIILVDVSVLWLTGKQVPELLGQLVLAVFASYFASTLTRAKGTPRRERGGAADGGVGSARAGSGRSVKQEPGAGEEVSGRGGK